jgi:hypothetical protein
MRIRARFPDSQVLRLTLLTFNLTKDKKAISSSKIVTDCPGINYLSIKKNNYHGNY